MHKAASESAEDIFTSPRYLGLAAESVLPSFVQGWNRGRRHGTSETFSMQQYWLDREFLQEERSDEDEPPGLRYVCAPGLVFLLTSRRYEGYRKPPEDIDVVGLPPERFSSGEQERLRCPVDSADESLPDTPAGILSEFLSDDTAESRRKYLAILAEAYDFDPRQKKQLEPALLRFIESYRDSNDPDDLTAVGAAIRKYVGMIDASRVGRLAALLESDHRMVLPVVLQLELAKMIARKFAAVPPSSPDPEPVLAERLSALACAYLNAFVLNDSKRAAVAMNAMQGLAGMLSPKFAEAAKQLKQSGCTWFQSQLHRRLLRLIAVWEEHISSDDKAGLVQRLREMTREADLT